MKYKYILMYKDYELMYLRFDTEYRITNVEIIEKSNKKYYPIAAMKDNKLAIELLDKWLHQRFIPRDRRGYEKLKEALHVRLIEEVIINHHAASLFDSYWIKMGGEELSWKNVSLFEKSNYEDEPKVFITNVPGKINPSSPTLTTGYDRCVLWQIAQPVEGMAKKPCMLIYEDGERLMKEMIAYRYSVKSELYAAQTILVSDHEYVCAVKSIKLIEDRNYYKFNMLFHIVDFEPKNETVIEHIRKIIATLEIKNGDDYLDQILLMSFLLSMPVGLEMLNIVADKEKLEFGSIISFCEPFVQDDYNPFTGDSIDNNLIHIKNLNYIESIVNEKKLEEFADEIEMYFCKNLATEIGKVIRKLYEKRFQELLRFLMTKKEQEHAAYKERVSSLESLV